LRGMVWKSIVWLSVGIQNQMYKLGCPPHPPVFLQLKQGNQAEVPARSDRMKLYFLIFLFGFISASPLPQDEDMPPMPYQFTNRVSEDNAELDEEDRGIYWTQDEGAPEDNPGRVEGEYSVWLADGRLMTVLLSFH